MNKRHVQLVHYLLKKGSPVTAKELSDYLGVSIRTVKNYIAAINQESTDKIIVSSVRGYGILPKNAKKYLEDFINAEEAIPQTYEERANYINRKFLMEHVTKLDIYDLSEELFVSIQTIKNDIQKMNQSFMNYRISYEIHSDDIFIIANEESLRKLARFTLFDSNSGGNILDYSLLKKVFMGIDIDNLKELLMKTFEEFDFFVNDFQMVNLLLHIAIIITRLKKRQVLENGNNHELGKEGVEYEMAQYLSLKIGEKYCIYFNESEIDNIFLLLKTNLSKNFSSSQDEIQEYVGKDFVHFTEELVKKLNNQYYVDLDNETFISMFALHCKQLLLRSENEKFAIDPMSEVIRYEYPIIFDMAVYAIKFFEERYKVRVDVSEVVYIALHIGGEMERQKVSSEKISTVLLCPRYLNFEAKIQKELLENFGSDLDMLACVSNMEDLKKFKFDLLIKAVSLGKENTTFEIVEVPLVSIENSKEKIELIIEKIKKQKYSTILKKNFDRFFDKQLFRVIRSKNIEKEEVMQIASNQLTALSYVPDNFFENILERDALSSTGFPNVAIPHSISMDAIKTSIHVLIFPEGLQWDEQNVKLVFTIAIHKADRYIFRELYQALVQLFSNENSINLIIRSRNFEEFKQTVLSLL